MKYDTDTITAQATPAGRGGVGIVRVSGSRCAEVAQRILGRVPRPREAVLLPFLDAQGQQIDEGIALYFAADPIAMGEVGKVGVSISSIRDMEQLFDQIPLDKVSTSMTINAPAGVLLSMYIAVAKRHGVDMKQLRGTIQHDILKEYVARGTYIFPPAPSMRLITDIFSFCAKEVPSWNTSQFPAIISVRQVPPPCRKWHLRLPTALPISKPH